MPRHNNTTNPAKTIVTKNRGRVTSTATARHGGNLARAAFHVIPPLGSNFISQMQTEQRSILIQKGQKGEGDNGI